MAVVEWLLLLACLLVFAQSSICRASTSPSAASARCPIYLLRFRYYPPDYDPEHGSLNKYRGIHSPSSLCSSPC